MKRITTLLLSIISFACIQAQDRREFNNLVLENIPEIPDEISERLNQYLNVRAASLSD